MTLILFSQGKISHDDHSRLRKINKVLQKAIDDGVLDDAAPSAQAAAKEPASPEQAARVQGFLQGAVERIFSNSQTSDFEPEWKSAPFDGDITSQREIWRMVRALHLPHGFTHIANVESPMVWAQNNAAVFKEYWREHRFRHCYQPIPLCASIRYRSARSWCSPAEHEPTTQQRGQA